MQIQTLQFYAIFALIQTFSKCSINLKSQEAVIHPSPKCSSLSGGDWQPLNYHHTLPNDSEEKGKAIFCPTDTEEELLLVS